jgi:hypothetical protein
MTVGFFNGSSNSSIASFLDSGSLTREYNTIYGLQGFFIINESFISWDISITPKISIDANISNSFLSFDFVYLIIEEYWCEGLTPYRLLATDLCYDVCPLRYFANDVGLTC